MENNNFKFKRSYYKAIASLNDRQAGEFVKSVCRYAFDGTPLTSKDPYLKALYLYVQRDFDISKQNSINAKKGVEKRKARKTFTVPMTVVEAVFSRENSDEGEDETGAGAIERLFKILAESYTKNAETEEKDDEKNMA